MRICIVGSGIAGLSAAFQLSQHEGTHITVLERDPVFGGRANVTAEGEHCPRIFLSDYSQLFAILRQIPGEGGGSVHDDLALLRRQVRTRDGWVETSHLYRVLAREVPIRERIRLAIEGRRPPLVAEQRYGPNTNRYGRLRNYTARSLLRVLSNLAGSRQGYALPGPTDRYLTGPWVRHLVRRGVELRAGTPVTGLRPDHDGVTVLAAGAAHRYDAVVVTAFLPDAATLLSASGLDHRLVDREHVHCKAATVELHPQEKVLAEAARPAIYCHDGINVVLQPRHHRCVVLCTWSRSTDDAYVLAKVREFLSLEHPVAGFHVRANQRPDEGVFSAEYVDPAAILRGGPAAHLYFAGSYVRNSYPIDSGEAAARSARQVVEQMRERYALGTAPAGDRA